MVELELELGNVAEFLDIDLMVNEVYSNRILVKCVKSYFSLNACNIPTKFAYDWLLSCYC